MILSHFVERWTVNANMVRGEAQGIAYFCTLVLIMIFNATRGWERCQMSETNSIGRIVMTVNNISPSPTRKTASFCIQLSV